MSSAIEMASEITRTQAQDLTARVKIAFGVGQIKMSFDSRWTLLAETYSTNAWQALGYASWADYYETELVDLGVRLSQPQLPKVILRLRAAGMSTRAIGTAVGVHHSTVAELLNSGVGNPTPESNAQVKGRDGKDYSKKSVDGVAGQFPKTVATALARLPRARRTQCVEEVIEKTGRLSAAKIEKWQQAPRHLAPVPQPAIDTDSEAAQEPVQADCFQDWKPDPTWLGGYPEELQEKVREHVREFIKEYTLEYAKAFRFALGEEIFG